MFLESIMILGRRPQHRWPALDGATPTTEASMLRRRGRVHKGSTGWSIGYALRYGACEEKGVLDSSVQVFVTCRVQ